MACSLPAFAFVAGKWRDLPCLFGRVSALFAGFSRALTRFGGAFRARCLAVSFFLGSFARLVLVVLLVAACALFAVRPRSRFGCKLLFAVRRYLSCVHKHLCS